MSQRSVLKEEREASFQFFEQVLRPEQDLVFVIGFDVDVELFQDQTNTPSLLEESLANIQLPRGERGGGVGTVLFDAVFLAADEVLSDQTGRKAVVLISDGVDFGSIVDLDRAIEAAQKADTVIYSIRYYDQAAYSGGRGRRQPPLGGGRPGMGRGPGSGPWGIPRGGQGPPPGGKPGMGRSPTDGRAILERLSSETGGTLFEVTGELSLEKIFHQIEEELRGQYIIGFDPPTGHPGSDYHELTLKTRRSDLRVQSRVGYYSK